MPEAKKKALTKAQVRAKIAETTALGKSSVDAVLDALTNLAIEELKSGSTFTISDLVKLKTSIKPATPEGERINPFTKQMQKFPAKPERKVVKATVLKCLKDSV